LVPSVSLLTTMTVAKSHINREFHLYHINNGMHIRNRG
jgi:hypothetical protein